MKKKISFEERTLQVALFLQIIPGGLILIFFVHSIMIKDREVFQYLVIFFLVVIFPVTIGILSSKSRTKRLKELGLEDENDKIKKDVVEPKLRLLWDLCRTFYSINLLLVWPMHNSWEFTPWLVSMILILILLIYCFDKIFGEKFKV